MPSKESTIAAHVPKVVSDIFSQAIEVTPDSISTGFSDIVKAIERTFKDPPSRYRIENRAKTLETFLEGLTPIAQEKVRRQGKRVTMTEITMKLLVNWPNDCFPFVMLTPQESLRVLQRLFRGDPLRESAEHLLQSGMDLKDVLIRMCQQVDSDYTSFVSNYRVYGQFAGENLLGFLRRLLLLVTGLHLFFSATHPDRTLLEMICKGPLAIADRQHMEIERIRLGNELETVYKHISMFAKAGYVSITDQRGRMQVDSE
ncbi:MAG: hypothetical protein KVP17_005302, partial [Porospora cf. gigantea B]|uniref:uncharacterized protein n=1 Tax=Porospora cf. gigantea B TaxID=2853592 RepID=UPI003571F3F4